MKIKENSIILTGSELDELIDDAIDVKITHQSRWQTYKEGIIEVEGKHYEIYWAEGSTEMQDSCNDGGTFQEVVKKEVVVEKWIPINQKV